MDVLPSQVGSRPFGPLPRSAVAVYGFVLAAAGLTLFCQVRRLDGFGAAGINGLLLGVACMVLAVRAGRGPRGATFDAVTAATPTDPRVAAARVVGELADLERQVDELTEQCATFDVRWPDGDPRTQPPMTPQKPAA
jgi:hypothetical protein